MSLTSLTQAALERLAPFAGRTELVQVEHSGIRLTCELAALESLACGLVRLEVHSNRLAALSADALREVARQLATRLTYLLEPIRLIEVDPEQGLAQLRSQPPHREAEVTSFYELLLSRGGGLRLVRFSRPAGQPRAAVPAQLTREVLLRLVSDFAAVA
jgi:hypothetical protein